MEAILTVRAYIAGRHCMAGGMPPNTFCPSIPNDTHGIQKYFMRSLVVGGYSSAAAIVTWGLDLEWPGAALFYIGAWVVGKHRV